MHGDPPFYGSSSRSFTLRYRYCGPFYLVSTILQYILSPFRHDVEVSYPSVYLRGDRQSSDAPL